MASDQLVTARHVLRSVSELQRRHSRRILLELERLEPDLAEYVIENLSQLHHKLARHDLSRDEVMHVFRHAESTLLVSLLALRQGYRELLGHDGLAEYNLPTPDDEPPTVDPPPLP